MQRGAKVTLPAPDAEGSYPATAALRAILAQQIAERRQAAGWTEAQLAHHARVRTTTLRRLESGKYAPNVAAVDRIDRALRAAGV